MLQTKIVSLNKRFHVNNTLKKAWCMRVVGCCHLSDVKLHLKCRDSQPHSSHDKKVNPSICKSHSERSYPKTLWESYDLCWWSILANKHLMLNFNTNCWGKKLTSWHTLPSDRHVMCLFILTLACFPSMTATHEFVVPRSIPMTEPLMASDLQWRNTQWLGFV